MKKARTILLILLIPTIIIIGLGIYVKSILPEPIGDIPQLQNELFQEPPYQRPVSGKYIYLSASELAGMVKRGEASAVRIAKEFMAHIINNNWKYNAIVWFDEDQVLEQAMAVDRAVARGDTMKPLLGVPITIKEQFFVKGFPSTLNNKNICVIPDRDAALVDQIRASGAVILGTTNCAFMVGDYQTFGQVYPTANNPYDTTKTPGGSTGGGAAALAAGFTSLELGSDLGGSIREPSAFCGLWGLKPGFGSLNASDGMMPSEIYPGERFAMGSPGPLARSAKDLSLFWKVLVKTKKKGKHQKEIDWKAPSNKELKEYKIAWMDEWPRVNGAVEISDDASDKLSEIVQILKGEGVILRKDIPLIYDELAALFAGTFAHIMGENEPWLMRKLMQKQFKNQLGNEEIMLEAMKKHLNICSQEQWEQIQKQREFLIDSLEDFFEEYDFLLTPTTFGSAFNKCPNCSTIETADGKQVNYINYFSYCFVFNASGHPCLNIPMGLNEEGLPIGVQLVGPYYSEPELLYFAELISPMVPGFVNPSGLK